MEQSSIMDGKTLLVTGGTGSFGNAVVKRFLKTEIKEIRIFSRDELKQDEMRKRYNDERLRYFIGDVRDVRSIVDAVKGADYIFHAAALKQVPSCEKFPIEAVKTNVIGTDNVMTIARSFDVKKVICLSTDKAAYPINAMGISKAMMEKIVMAHAQDTTNTKFCITRYGNVMCSRGSVIPIFVERAKNNLPINVTEMKMTRFLMSLEEAVDLVMFAFRVGGNGELLVRKADSCTVGELAIAIKEMYNSKSVIKEIGIRHGEKIHETLLTAEEYANSTEYEQYFSVSPDSRNLYYENHPILKTVPVETTFNSYNAKRLSISEIKQKIQETT